MGRLAVNRPACFVVYTAAGLELAMTNCRTFQRSTSGQGPDDGLRQVVDRRTGIFFHAGELRQALEQVAEEGGALKQVYDSDIFRDQLGKYRYLVEKFLASVSHPSTLHVFSDFHEELTDEAMLSIHSSLRSMGKPSGNVAVRPCCGSADVVNEVFTGDDPIGNHQTFRPW